MSSSSASDDGGATPSGRRRELLALLTVTVLAVVALDALLVRDPELLALDVELSVTTSLFLALAATVCALLFLRRGFALVVLVGLAFLNLSEVLVRFHDMPSVLQLLFLPLGFAALVHARADRAWPRLGNALTALLVGHSLLLLSSTIWARDTAAADSAVAANLKAMGIYVLVALLITSLEDARKGAWALSGAAAVPAALGTWQVLTGSFGEELGGLARIKDAQIYGDVFEPRIAGTLGDPNFFAQMLLLALPVAVILTRNATGTTRRLAAGACAVAILCGTVFSYSRGAALALLVVVPAMLLALRLDRRWIAAAVAVGVALTLLLLPADFTRRLATIGQLLPGGEEQTLDPDSSFAERKLLMTLAWRMFLDHPVAGVGAANYDIRFEEYAEQVDSASRQYQDPGGDAAEYPHNLYLEVAAETGLLGLVLFGAIVTTCFVYLYRAREAFRRAGRRFGVDLATALAISLTGYLLAGLFLHLQFPRPLWVIFGFAAALHGLGRMTPKAESTAIRPASATGGAA